MTVNGDKSDYISGHFRAKDWIKRRDELVVGSRPEAWTKAVDDFFMHRLKTRYLDPIKHIQIHGGSDGAGFAIVTIQCALIEFLEATKKGKNYVYRNKGEKEGEHEYTDSKAVFKEFLKDNKPFSDWFIDEEKTKDFYSSVRCGLLHEARTKNGWKILTVGESGIDYVKKEVNRNLLQDSLVKYIEEYAKDLTMTAALQEAFLRKYNHLIV